MNPRILLAATALVLVLAAGAVVVSDLLRSPEPSMEAPRSPRMEASSSPRDVTEAVTTRTFMLKDVRPSEIHNIILPLLTPEVGQSLPNDSTGQLAVTDTPTAIDRIERLIGEIAEVGDAVTPHS